MNFLDGDGFDLFLLEILDPFDEFIIEEGFFGIFPEIRNFFIASRLFGFEFYKLIFVKSVANSFENYCSSLGRVCKGFKLGHVVLGYLIKRIVSGSQ